MAKLIYMLNMSLDGYIQDEQGDITFAAPTDPEVHNFLFHHASSFRTLLYGRKIYEIMLYWETSQDLPDQTPSDIEFAQKWQAAEKIVYSRTLTEPRSSNTIIRPSFDPEEVRKLKAERDHDIIVAGPELAAEAIAAGLVDEFQLRICPMIIGGGKRYFPTGVRLNLQLLEDRQFRNGEIFLRYAVRD